jgi:hypothetical protein
MVWGLDDFEPLGTPGRRKLIMVSQDDLYHRLCTPETWNAYLIEGWVFPDRYWAAVRNRGGRLTMTLSFTDFIASSGVMEFSVIPLPNQPIIIGILVSRFKLELSPPTSGFSLNSPSDSKHAIYAFYPPWTADGPHQSLNYCPKRTEA